MVVVVDLVGLQSCHLSLARMLMDAGSLSQMPGGKYAAGKTRGEGENIGYGNRWWRRPETSTMTMMMMTMMMEMTGILAWRSLTNRVSRKMDFPGPELE